MRTICRFFYISIFNGKILDLISVDDPEESPSKSKLTFIHIQARDRLAVSIKIPGKVIMPQR